MVSTMVRDMFLTYQSMSSMVRHVHQVGERKEHSQDIDDD